MSPKFKMFPKISTSSWVSFLISSFFLGLVPRNNVLVSTKAHGFLRQIESASPFSTCFKQPLRVSSGTLSQCSSRKVSYIVLVAFHYSKNMKIYLKNSRYQLFIIFDDTSFAYRRCLSYRRRLYCNIVPPARTEITCDCGKSSASFLWPSSSYCPRASCWRIQQSMPCLRRWSSCMHIGKEILILWRF